MTCLVMRRKQAFYKPPMVASISTIPNVDTNSCFCVITHDTPYNKARCRFDEAIQAFPYSMQRFPTAI